MVQMYTIFGRQVGSHVLSMAVLGTMFGGTFLAMGGSSKKPQSTTPPINASSPDEENFIKKFMDEADAADKPKAAKQ